MKKFIIIAALALCPSFVWAADAQMYKLDNGQTVVIQEVRNNPIVIIDTWIKTGSIDENDENNGVAHFLEHLFFKGTKNHEPGDFDKILETKGAITNAATSKDFTHYYITIPSKDFDMAMDLHADMMLNPLIPRNEMEKERKVVLEEINKDLTSPSKILYDNLVSMLYKNHPYKRKVIGKSEVIETITRDQIFNFYNSHYSPSNMVTVVIGDVDSEHALDKIKQNFNAEYNKTEKKDYEKEPQLKTQEKKVAYIPTETGYMAIGFRGVSINDKDSYALDVLATILGEGRSSILNQELKEKRRLAFSIDAGNSTMRDDGMFYISAEFEPEKCKTIQDAVFSEINKIQEKGITEEQLNLAKNIIERNTYYSRESITNIATEIGYTVALTDNMKFYDKYLDNIKAVSASDVKRVAEKYLGINKSAVSIVMPETMKNIPVANKQKLSGTAQLVSKNENTQKYNLSNGATLLYTPNTSNDIIAISITAKGGQLLDKIPGTSSMTALTMLKGTKNYTSQELSQILEDNGIKIAPSVSADAFSITVLTTKDEYNKTLELLDEIVNNATFDDYEIGKVKSDKLNAIKSEKDIPLRQAIEEYRNLIYKDTPYSISSKVLEQNIQNIKRKDIVEYYNNIFNPKNMVISINGNIDLNTTVQELTNIFTPKKDTAATFDFNTYNSKIPAITSKRVTVQNMPTTETAWILLGWQVNGVLNEKDFATLQVIDSILGTGMSSRLFKDLREQQGLAYQLGSGYSPNVLRGSFMMYIGTNPATLEKAKAGLFEEIHKLKTEYVSDRELKDAKEKLLGNYIIGLETNLDKASVTGWYETTTRGYEFSDRYENLINSVTDADIIETANKYFTDNYIMSIVTK